MTNTRAIRLGAIGGPLDEVRRHVQAATANLLGATIAYSDDDWAENSALPGWTRSHVAAHLAISAIRMSRMVGSALRGDDLTPLHISSREMDMEIEFEATRDPLNLQIELDTSAGLLATAFHDLSPDASAKVIALRPGLEMPLQTALLVRLSEVILHHWDLLDGYTLADVEIEPVLWSLELRARILADDEQVPAVRLIADEGLDLAIGNRYSSTLVRGDARTLLGWITGRTEAPPGHPLGRLPLS